MRVTTLDCMTTFKVGYYKTLHRIFKLNKCNVNVITRDLVTSLKMANSKYDYVRSFELDDKILPNVWIVVRIDGKAFHKFSKEHDFVKPNDERGEWLRFFFKFRTVQSNSVVKN